MASKSVPRDDNKETLSYLRAQYPHRYPEGGVTRNCLKCDSVFHTESTLIRLCNTCKNIQRYSETNNSKRGVSFHR